MELFHYNLLVHAIVRRQLVIVAVAQAAGGASIAFLVGTRLSNLWHPSVSERISAKPGCRSDDLGELLGICLLAFFAIWG